MTNIQYKELDPKISSLINCLSKVKNSIDKVSAITRLTNMVSMIFFFLMVALVFVDVFLRYVLNSPIPGTNEMVGLFLVIVVGFAISYTQNEHGHIGVDVVTSLISYKSRLMVNTITTAIGISLMSIMIWRNMAQCIYNWNTNHLATYAPISIPSAPFIFILFIGCLFFVLLLIRDLLNNIINGLKLGLRCYQWLIISGVVLLLGIMAVLWMQPAMFTGISLSIVGLGGLICSVLFLLTGMPIAFAMIATGLLFIGHIRGVDTAFDTLGVEMFRIWSSYTWAVLAFFIIMGLFCLYARFGEDLYKAAAKWLGRLPGGLCMATIAACTAMAAVVGDTLSVVSTMTAVALPQMKKEKYDVGFCAGTIAAGATIGPMIPPSMCFIMYGLLTQQSIGKLFIAGIIPGLILGLAFGISIYIQCLRNPLLGPRSLKSTWRERFISLKLVGPILILFILVIGGIYAGIFTATEGGAIGAVGALIIGLIMKRFNWNSFTNSLVDAGKIVAMIFLILLGATLMTRFIAWCNVSEVISNFIVSLSLPDAGKIIVILLIYLLLGFFIDVLPITLIMVPISHPIAVSLGYDPIWMAVLTVAVLQVGLITPPVATNLFAIKGIAKDIPMSTIYRGVLPFVITTLIVMIILFTIQPVVTWLPNLLF